MAERRLFGTDGVRGAVGDFLTADLAMRLGRAAALAVDSERPRALVIRDTRSCICKVSHGRCNMPRDMKMSYGKSVNSFATATRGA